MLLSIAKLQNLKAIHNSLLARDKRRGVVINHKITKFESNSQPSISGNLIRYGCYQSQNYKIWKQFTTSIRKQPIHWKLLSITKLQNLKAIHNKLLSRYNQKEVVINHKTTKFESNLQRFKKSTFFISSCYQSQNYKIWKQFTTSYFITALTIVVINHKTTKFESNSQLFLILLTNKTLPW